MVDRSPCKLPSHTANPPLSRIAVGVFLLNKDVIQLLQAHGVSAGGPNHLLHNLHKLLLAAQSALPAPRLLAGPRAGGLAVGGGGAGG